MESDQDRQHQVGGDQSEDAILLSQGQAPEMQQVTEVVPGAPVTRGNTPRPQPFEALLAASGRPIQEPQYTANPAPRPTFPSQAPSAPPLPEEIEPDEQIDIVSDSEAAPVRMEVASGPQEFIWLFEYGLEMESAVLNSPDRLDGAAFLYGPAVLKGYTLMFAEVPQRGRYLEAIVPSGEAGGEVWGVLYRVPRRVTIHDGKQPSLLDSIHEAGTPSALFSPISIVVREIYREREISCGTYTLTSGARQQLRLLTPEQADHVTSLVQHIVALARLQKLPATYPAIPTRAPSMPALSSSVQSGRSTVATAPQQEQNTDPLPVLKETDTSPTRAALVARPAMRVSSSWLIALALYHIFVLASVLAFAVLQSSGFARHILAIDIQLLGVPWLVLVYGVLGGSVSSIIALGRARRVTPPLYVIILWFVRPLLGGVLALFSYLFFNSGLFTIVAFAARHTTLFPLIGACAGFCEGWLFSRRSP